jgi:hypothetical protein
VAAEAAPARRRRVGAEAAAGASAKTADARASPTSDRAVARPTDLGEQRPPPYPLLGARASRPPCSQERMDPVFGQRAGGTPALPAEGVAATHRPPQAGLAQAPAAPRRTLAEARSRRSPPPVSAQPERDPQQRILHDALRSCACKLHRELLHEYVRRPAFELV